MSEDFYKAFEDKHRGSRELIKSRQRAYLPFVEPLLSIYTDAKAIDLGCGRGEWLELLKESGFDGHGVDLDDGMLSACRQQGLSVSTQDAISALIALPDESQLVVSGFHIAEHIQFSDLQLLVQEALRVLKPGGLLILETPNPENIKVGTVNFYLDPTHEKPIPPQLLSFLPEFYGFARVKVIRLHEDMSLVGKSLISLHDVLGGVSPDYAVVAQKSADAWIFDCVSVAFAKEYGLDLGALVDKYDQQVIYVGERAVLAEAQAQHASERAVLAEAQAQHAIERAASAEAQAQHASERVVLAEAQAQHASERAVLAEAQAQHASECASNAVLALEAIHNSSSWRITAPFRMISRAFSAFSQAPKDLKLTLKERIKLLLSHASLYVNRRPKLRHAAQVVLARFPTVKARLKVVTMNRPVAQTTAQTVSTDLTALTPRTRQIYTDLKAAIAHRRKESS